MTVSSTVGFAETGVLIVDKEVISYSHKSSTAFLGLRRYAAYPRDILCFELGSLGWHATLCRPFAVRHGANCAVNAGITPITSAACAASPSEPLDLANELASYDIVFTTYSALMVQERLLHAVAIPLAICLSRLLQASHAVFAQIQWRRIVLDECQEVGTCGYRTMHERLAPSGCKTNAKRSLEPACAADARNRRATVFVSL
jgi:hypothetical protein